MSLKDATRLEMHIRQVAPNWRPQAEQIGNGEWIVKLKGHREQIVWSAQDWNENFVGRPVQQEEQVMV